MVIKCQTQQTTKGRRYEEVGVDIFHQLFSNITKIVFVNHYRCKIIPCITRTNCSAFRIALILELQSFVIEDIATVPIKLFKALLFLSSIQQCSVKLYKYCI